MLYHFQITGRTRLRIIRSGSCSSPINQQVSGVGLWPRTHLNGACAVHNGKQSWTPAQNKKMPSGHLSGITCAAYNGSLVLLK